MPRLQEFLSRVFTGRRRLKAEQLAKMTPRSVFESIYERNGWKGTESVSGLGSDREQTARIVAELPRVLRELGARSLLDIPCGDFYWMRHVALDGIEYVGADIVEDLVRGNEAFASESRSFVSCDLLTDALPSVDAIFCRDCLVHFSNHHVWQALRNIARSDAKYLITTSFTDRGNEKQIVTGQWRPLNLQADPFCLPAPCQWIDEQCTQDNGAYPDKMLGVWSAQAVREVCERSQLAA